MNERGDTIALIIILALIVIGLVFGGGGSVLKGVGDILGSLGHSTNRLARWGEIKEGVTGGEWDIDPSVLRKGGCEAVEFKPFCEDLLDTTKVGGIRVLGIKITEAKKIAGEEFGKKIEKFLGEKGLKDLIDFCKKNYPSIVKGATGKDTPKHLYLCESPAFQQSEYIQLNKPFEIKIRGNPFLEVKGQPLQKRWFVLNFMPHEKGLLAGGSTKTVKVRTSKKEELLGILDGIERERDEAKKMEAYARLLMDYADFEVIYGQRMAFFESFLGVFVTPAVEVGKHQTGYDNPKKAEYYLFKLMLLMDDSFMALMETRGIAAGERERIAGEAAEKAAAEKEAEKGKFKARVLFTPFVSAPDKFAIKRLEGSSVVDPSVGGEWGSFKRGEPKGLPKQAWEKITSIFKGKPKEFTGVEIGHAELKLPRAEGRYLIEFSPGVVDGVEYFAASAEIPANPEQIADVVLTARPKSDLAGVVKFKGLNEGAIAAVSQMVSFEFAGKELEFKNEGSGRFLLKGIGESIQSQNWPPNTPITADVQVKLDFSELEGISIDELTIRDALFLMGLLETGALSETETAAVAELFTSIRDKRAAGSKTMLFSAGEGGRVLEELTLVGIVGQTYGLSEEEIPVAAGKLGISVAGLNTIIELSSQGFSQLPYPTEPVLTINAELSSESAEDFVFLGEEGENQ